ncbi:MAG: hypothetical protein HY362_03200 [Candidatus Aenigmarchaeota archaeon]|nr:hypothetical protein [Candidatus Aenigmarchaeota archaeon]
MSWGDQILLELGVSEPEERERIGKALDDNKLLLSMFMEFLRNRGLSNASDKDIESAVEEFLRIQAAAQKF